MSESITVTVNGVAKEIAADQRPTHLFAESSDVVVARSNGQIRDLWTELASGDVVEAVTIPKMV